MILPERGEARVVLRRPLAREHQTSLPIPPSQRWRRSGVRAESKPPIGTFGNLNEGDDRLPLETVQSTLEKRILFSFILCDSPKK